MHCCKPPGSLPYCDVVLGSSIDSCSHFCGNVLKPCNVGAIRLKLGNCLVQFSQYILGLCEALLDFLGYCLFCNVPDKVAPFIVELDDVRLALPVRRSLGKPLLLGVGKSYEPADKRAVRALIFHAPCYAYPV